MPFGLCNAPSFFQATMNQLFQPYLHKHIIIFFDDILIYSKTIVDHLLHLENAFQILVSGQFSLKLSKCMFAQQQLEYLGHLVAGEGVRPVPEKVLANSTITSNFKGFPWPRRILSAVHQRIRNLSYPTHQAFESWPVSVVI